jgi:precorrin-8X/cobalt-precorrin-8 methylmutase
MTTPHPIEVASYEILASRVDLSGLTPGVRAVVERVVHASADLDYVKSLVLDEGAVDAGVAALRAGAPVITDVEMVRHGITVVDAVCHLGEARSKGAPSNGRTLSARGMEIAARRCPHGAVVVVGCAPTALREVLRLVSIGAFEPALVIGLPVGFVGAADSKAETRASGLASITNIGEKGGSAVAAAALNALGRLAGVAGLGAGADRDTDAGTDAGCEP